MLLLTKSLLAIWGIPQKCVFVVVIYLFFLVGMGEIGPNIFLVLMFLLKNKQKITPHYCYSYRKPLSSNNSRSEKNTKNNIIMKCTCIYNAKCLLKTLKILYHNRPFMAELLGLPGS